MSAKPLAAVLLLLTGIPGTTVSASLAAQTVRAVEGRIVDTEGVGIPGATVALEGVGFRFTDADGDFRFGSVVPRAYQLRVEALGYEGTERGLVVDDEDVSVTIELTVSPLLLDSIVVETRSVDLEGRVWDPAKDIPVQLAEVRSDQADPTETSWAGRFKIRVGEGTPVRLYIGAFRYLPLDTTVVATRDEDHRFELRPDSLVLKMIDAEIARLDDRAGGRRAVGMPPLHREDLVRWSGASLRDILKARFPGRGAPRCIVLDEKDVGGPMLGPTLDITFADDLERIEFLFGGAMMRIYTRTFMRRMLGGGLELRRPVYSDMPDPPLCL